VLDANKAQEEGLINGRDDDLDLDDPIACRLEGVLASFRYQMRLEMSCSMKSTHLTDYFHCV
jgi:hypothetical protein